MVEKKFSELPAATSAAAFTFAGVQGGATSKMASSVLLALLGALYTPEDFGALGDGVTDDFAAIQAAINAAGATTGAGGTVLFGAKTYRCNSQLTFPVSADSTPRMKPVVLRGVSSHWAGQATTPYGGSILDIRASDALGKIVTYGLGLLTIENLALYDGGTNTNPFVYTTFTTLHIHGCAFYGNPTKSAATCDQDAIVCGGTTTTTTGAGTDNAFQGYGTVLERNYFSRIRRALYGRTHFNAVVFSSNTVWNTCGTNLASGACVELDGGSGPATGNQICLNLIEQNTYPYAFKLANANSNSLIGNTIYDNNAAALFGYRLESTAGYNLVIATQVVNSAKSVSDAGTANTVINATQNLVSSIPNGLTVGGNFTTSNPTFTGDGSSRVTIQPTSSGIAAGAIMATLKRGASEGTNPAGTVMSITYGGTLFLGDGSGAGSSLTNNGRTWVASGSGGGMLIDSGTGGSNIDLKAAATRVTYFSGGAVLLRFGGSGQDKIEFGSALDTNLYRSAANTLKTDDKLIAAAGIGVGNAAAATVAVGSLSNKIEVFDAAGASLGFVPVYASIT